MVDRQIDEWMDRQANGCQIDGWMDRLLDGQMFRELDRLRQVESKRQMGGWTGRWIGRQMDGSQIDVS